MLTLTRRQQFFIGFALVALMLTTRGHHFPSIKHWLPTASWAIFFLAGVYLRPIIMLPVLFGVAAAIDYFAITVGGVSAFCVSPAYIALVPAYGALWLAGRWYARHAQLTFATLLPLVTAVLVGTALCELISSGSFYFFSGRFAEPTISEFAQRFAHYFPNDLRSVGFWVGAAALVHAAIATARARVSA